MRKIFLTLVLAGATVAAFAQTEIQTKRGPYLTNRFFDNWFISAGGGVNVYMGTADSKAKFGDRMAPAVTASIGKWITPSVGIRLSYWGLKAKGASLGYAKYSEPRSLKTNGYAVEKFNFMNIHADFMWNLSSALGGYKEHRFWEFVPFGGFGYAESSKSGRGKDQEFAMTAGLINKIRLSRAVNVNWEINGLMVKNTFDGVRGKKKVEGMIGTTLGLTYNFSRRGFDRQKIYEKPDYAPYNNRINALENDLTAAQARARQLAADLEAARNRPVAAGTTEYVLPQTAIWFPIGSSVLSEQEKINIGYLADALKKSGKKITISGNADSTTGSARYNQTLSERRANVVRDELVKAGVNASQLTIVANGDKKEPFAHNRPVLNRVVITE